MSSRPVFALEDVKAGLFYPPFVVETKVMALRGLEEIVNNPDTQVGKYASDFRLVYIGRYDDTTGQMMPDVHDVVAWASELKRPDPQQLLQLVPEVKPS